MRCVAVMVTVWPDAVTTPAAPGNMFSQYGMGPMPRKLAGAALLMPA